MRLIHSGTDSLEASSQTFSSEEMIETNLQCIDIARSEPRCVSIQRQARYVRPSRQVHRAAHLQAEFRPEVRFSRPTGRKVERSVRQCSIDSQFRIKIMLSEAFLFLDLQGRRPSVLERARDGDESLAPVLQSARQPALADASINP